MADVQPRQRPHAVNAVRETHGFVIRRLQVRIGKGRFANKIPVIAAPECDPQRSCLRILKPDSTIVKLEFPCPVHQPRIHAGGVPKVLDFPLELIQHSLEKLQGTPNSSLGFGQSGKNFVADDGLKGCVHSPGNCPGRMNALLGEALDHLLPELAQSDAVEGDVRILLK